MSGMGREQSCDDVRYRPISGIGGLELLAPKLPVGSVPGAPKEAPKQWAHTGRRHKGRLRRQVQGLQAAARRSGAQSCALPGAFEGPMLGMGVMSWRGFIAN